jgi:hypothetical protein
MSGRIPARIARLCAASLAAVAVGAVMASAASAEVVYDNVPSPLPGNFASIGLAATSTSEFGGEVELAGTARKQPTVTVVMSSWSCETGGVGSGCTTKKPGKGFKIPLTVRVYAANELEEGPIAEKTKTVKMLYRPTEDTVKCSTGAWYDATDSACYHGFAFPVSVKLGMLKKMPKKAIVTFSYPHSSGPAESLNVATSEPEEKTLSIGSDPIEEWIVNSTWTEMYCPGAKDVGTLGTEEGVGCQEGINFQPVFSVSAN